jgi:hypothetical protein
MSLTELLPVLRSLDRADKLRAMQFLVQELAKEEGALLTRQAEYAVWSPHNAFDAADTLLGVLSAADASRSRQAG